MGETNGGAARSDTLVLFGASGDLANKMIFPALYAMAKRGTLTVPVIGVASSGRARSFARGSRPSFNSSNW